MQITSQALPHAADCFFKECLSLKFYPITILKKTLCFLIIYQNKGYTYQITVSSPRTKEANPTYSTHANPIFSMNLLSSVLTKANLASIFQDSSISSHYRKCNPQFSKTRVLPRLLCTLAQNTVFSTHWDISGNFLFNICT